MKLILAVDPSAPLRQVIRLLLPQFGYEVITAASGAQALDQLEVEWTLRKRLINLILAELELDPAMTGLELARVVHAQPRYQAIPFVFMTGGGLAASYLELVSVEALLLKPFGLHDLTEFIGRFLAD